MNKSTTDTPRIETITIKINDGWLTMRDESKEEFVRQLHFERLKREKAEAEVERLNGQLKKRAIEIAEQSVMFHPSISRFERRKELDQIKATLNPTDTPRTHEVMWTTDYHHELCNVVNTEFAQQLERELTEAKAEVEFWKAKAHEAEFHEGKHEAEVERLREQLESTKQLALKFWKVLEENGFKLELPK